MSFLYEPNLTHRERNYLIYSPAGGPDKLWLWSNYQTIPGNDQKFYLHEFDPATLTFVQQALVFDVPLDNGLSSNLVKPPIGINGTVFIRGNKSNAPNFGETTNSYIKSGLNMTRIDGSATVIPGGTISTDGDMIENYYVRANTAPVQFSAYQLIGNVLSFSGGLPVSSPVASVYRIPNQNRFLSLITTTEQDIFELVAGVPALVPGAWPAQFKPTLALTPHVGAWNHSGTLFAFGGAGNLPTNSYYTVPYDGSTVTGLNVLPYAAATPIASVAFSKDDTRVAFLSNPGGAGQLLRLFKLLPSGAVDFEYTNLSADQGGRAVGISDSPFGPYLFVLQNRTLYYFSIDDVAQTIQNVLSIDLPGTVSVDFITSARFYYAP
jgi:hypothetical protein